VFSSASIVDFQTDDTDITGCVFGEAYIEDLSIEGDVYTFRNNSFVGATILRSEFEVYDQHLTKIDAIDARQARLTAFRLTNQIVHNDFKVDSKTTIEFGDFSNTVVCKESGPENCYQGSQPV